MGADGRYHPDQLITRAQQGDSDCLGSLLELYRNYLYVVARTQIDLHLQGVVNPSDLVQEAFLEAYRDFGQFQGKTESELLGWLRRILIHNLARLVEKQVLTQKRDVRREVSLEDRLRELEHSSEKVEAALVSPWSSPSAQAQQRELAAVLSDQLARLPADYRDVIILRHLESLPFDEVARRMGRAPGAVRMLWLRALDRLRALLEEGDFI